MASVADTEIRKTVKTVWTRRSSVFMTEEKLKGKLGNKISIRVSYKSSPHLIDVELDEAIVKAARAKIDGTGYAFPEEERDIFIDGPFQAKRAAAIARRIKTAAPKVKIVLYSYPWTKAK